ncbi:MAG: 2-C-methyl-D-erythritol 4-phosphate cytidylyltransferase [Parachlamydiaceae bacterium]
MKKHVSTSAILLAGGIGSRMHTSSPKQFLSLGGKPIVRYSFDLFLEMPEIAEIVVVCDPAYRVFFESVTSNKPIHFALPGTRRQDSLYHGLQAATLSHELICVHDAARPLIDREIVLRVLEAGERWGAATAGMPVKFTVKQSTPHNFVASTPDRSHLWEIQTPQVLRRDILEEGFCYAQQHGITVTDDVSLAELLGKEVKLVEGSYTNLKITTASDLIVAGHLIC